jgi:hypothetical protein
MSQKCNHIVKASKKYQHIAKVIKNLFVPLYVPYQGNHKSSAPTDKNKAAKDNTEFGAAFEYNFAGMASDDTGPLWSYLLPANLCEALNGPDADHWQKALAKELGEFDVNEVYEEVPILHSIKPITLKPVFCVKLNQNGNVNCFKIRIMACGFTQQAGKDYDKTFAPVANLESICILLALTNKYNLELNQMDVSTAYLNSKLLEELYLAPPNGVQIKPGHCWRLKKSLYGLKQAGRTWNHTLDKALGDLSFACLCHGSDFALTPPLATLVMFNTWRLSAGQVQSSSITLIQSWQLRC